MNLKNKIAAKFSAAADIYESEAGLQKKIASRLLLYAATYIAADASVLDLGCGTGFIAQGLGRKITQLDIALEMCRAANKFSPAVCADIEALPFKENSFDIIFSSSAMQWLSHEKAIAEVKNILRENGYFCFSIFGPKTMQELRGMYDDFGIEDNLNQFKSSDEISAILTSRGFEILRFESEINKLDFPNAKDLLYYMKNIGAGVSVKNSSALTRQSLKKLEKSGAISSSWEVFYFIARKQ